MKSLKVLSALLISSTVLMTTACTPQDKKIGTPELMAKIRKPKGNKGGDSATEGIKISSYSASSIVLEKNIEALEILQVALGNIDKTKTRYSVSEKSEGESHKALTFTVTASNEPLNYSNKMGAFKSSLIQNFNVTQITAGQEAGTIHLKAVKAKASADALDLKKTFVNIFEDEYTMDVQAAEGDATKLKVAVNAKGTFNMGSSAGFKKGVYLFATTLVVDSASLDEEQIKILDMKTAMSVDGSDFGLSSQNMTVKLDGGCNEITGAAVMETDRNKKTISADKGSFSVGANWKLDASECGHRPTVDVGRLLIWK